jgi:hypothetical protein
MDMFEDKYHLSAREEKFLLKKNLVELVYNTGKFEALNTTLLQTREIVTYGRANNVSVDDVLTIVNLKRGYELIPDGTNNYFEFMLQANKIVASEDALVPGALRNGSTQVSLLSSGIYLPEIPDEAVEREWFEKKENEEITCTEKAMDVFLHISSKQLLWDGNKRTATVVANKILFDYQSGIFSVPEEKFFEFNQLLSDFYVTGKSMEIKNFIYEFCIFGIDYKE